MRIYDFRQKEVINLADGARLGYVFDAEIDSETGKVNALIIPGQGKVLGLFGKDNELVIPWESIKKIGDDIVLIDTNSISR
ncbi:MAG: YlmC/YmxH family sporulation protein [Clostridia bacterium]|nr:YlmC/YmxH family sporulation protein [Oscillospiraceae bacterium]MBQ7032916.1 YlmC/YmxH family sporulation protein [Clostridia bacterium]